MLATWGPWILGIAAYLAFALVANLCMRGPRPDPGSGLALVLLTVYARLRHRLKVSGRANIPTPEQRGGRPLIVVANHLSGVDPVLIQVALPSLFVRWAMGADMRVAALDWVWKFTDVIFVDRSGASDPAAMRAMLAHLESGGVLGVLPEGRLRPVGMPLGAFQPGVGLLARRTDALILPVVLRGLPRTTRAFDALWMTSRSRIEIKPVLDPQAGGAKAGAAEIAAGLRARYLEWLLEEEA